MSQIHQKRSRAFKNMQILGLLRKNNLKLGVLITLPALNFKFSWKHSHCWLWYIDWLCFRTGKNPWNCCYLVKGFISLCFRLCLRFCITKSHILENIMKPMKFPKILWAILFSTFTVILKTPQGCYNYPQEEAGQ